MQGSGLTTFLYFQPQFFIVPTLPNHPISGATQEIDKDTQSQQFHIQMQEI